MLVLSASKAAPVAVWLDCASRSLSAAIDSMGASFAAGTGVMIGALFGAGCSAGFCDA